MRTIDSWLNEYGESHQHPINRLIHQLTIPLIMMSVLVLMVWFLPVIVFAILVLALLSFYLVVSRPLALGMLILLALELGAVYWIHTHAQIKLWIVSLAIFGLGWILQFIGHAIEGKRPPFTRNLVFLLIGPAWLIAPLFPASTFRNTSLEPYLPDAGHHS